MSDTAAAVPVLFPLEHGKPPVEFRFDVKTALALEERAGCAPWVLAARGQSIKAIVLMLTFALRHARPDMTEKQAVTLTQRYLKHGGRVKLLADALANAMRAAGVYGDDETGLSAEDDTAVDADPQTATAEGDG